MGRPGHGPVRSRTGKLGSCPPPATRPVAAALALVATSSRPALRPPGRRSAGVTHRRALRRRSRHDARRPTPRTAARVQRSVSTRGRRPAAPRRRAVAALPDRLDGRPNADVPTRRPTAVSDGNGASGDGPAGRRRLFRGRNHVWDPGSRHRPLGVAVRVLVVVLPWQPRVPLGLRRRQQRLPVRSRPQRVQAAPRRVRPGSAAQGHEGLLRRRGDGKVGPMPCRWWKVTTPEKGAWAYAGQSRPSLTLQTCVGGHEPVPPDRPAHARSARAGGLAVGGVPQTTRRPRMRRAMTRRWTWLVPSPISVSLASRR